MLADECPSSAKIAVVKWLLFAAFVLGTGACHIISGGDEIVVAPDDDGGSGTEGSGSNTTVGGSSGSGSNCPSTWDCDEFGCWCTTTIEIDGFPCTDPTFDPQFNCELECEYCQ